MNPNDPASSFNKLIREKGYVLSLSEPRVRYMKDGALLIEPPQIIVNFTPQKRAELLEAAEKTSKKDE